MLGGSGLYSSLLSRYFVGKVEEGGVNLYRSLGRPI